MADARPILFSAPMVAALLDGRKTETRRLATSPLARRQPGDLLWVRETHKQLRSSLPARRHDPCADVMYADSDDYDLCYRDLGWRTVPSIHMPRGLSRITLELRQVEQRNLLDLSPVDVRAEGLEIRQMWLFGADAEQRREVARQVFRPVWEQLHGPHTFYQNPRVVVLRFRVHQRNVDQLLSER